MIQSDCLPCGVRVVTEEMPDARAACIGLWIGAGSAKEEAGQAGISHFIEHMMFKGTETRSAKQIAVDVDDLGASINAFTGKEATCYHIKALSEHFPKAVDILLDMLCNSVFDPVEINKERGVILEEMQMIQDTPDDHIIDLLSQSVLKDSGLAPSIIGTKTSLGRMSRPKMIRYIKNHYTRDNIVVSVVGSFDQTALFEQLERALAPIPEKSLSVPESDPSPGQRFHSKSKDIGQTHIAIGRQGVSLGSELYYAQAIANDVLGGSMSSRLFQNIREERGLAYSVYSAASSYRRTGMYFIYAGIGCGKEEETLSAIESELSILRREGLDQENIEVVKQRLKSGYVFSLESMNGRMYRLGKNMLLLNRIFTSEEVMADIDAVSRDEVQEICRQIGDFSSYSGVSISREKLNLKHMMSGMSTTGEAQ